MRICKVKWREVSLPFKEKIYTSYGVLRAKHFFLLALEDSSGLTGYGELEAFTLPAYTEETLTGAMNLIEQLLIPELVKHDIEHPAEVRLLYRWIKGNNMAKSAVETAVWDLYAKRNHCSLSSLLGAKKKRFLLA